MPAPSSSAPANNAFAPTPTNKYVREILHSVEPPPQINVRFFYTSPLAIDDPLSPLPPPLTNASASTYKHPPRPFSVYDNEALNEAWHDVRKDLLKLGEQGGGEKKLARAGSGVSAVSKRGIQPSIGEGEQPRDIKRRSNTSSRRQQEMTSHSPSSVISGSQAGGSFSGPSGFGSSLKTETRLVDSLSTLDAADGSYRETVSTTGNPFIRAPSRTKLAPAQKARNENENRGRPPVQALDSYDWAEGQRLVGEISISGEETDQLQRRTPDLQSPSAKVPVGVSRLHDVVIPQLQMEPIYWSPVHDVAEVIRGTWFYQESMLPVEADVANMLELGYVNLRPWTETWLDELNSAVEVGALGEMKIIHKLWPEKMPKPVSRPGTARSRQAGQVLDQLEDVLEDPEKERQEIVANAGDLIDVATGPDGQDHKAAGVTKFGRDGRRRQYLPAGVIYASDKEAYILGPNVQPSEYYGRRPLASYIRKGRRIGVKVLRGFDQAAWDKLHPPKLSSLAKKAREGVSTSQDGAPPERRRRSDPTLSRSLRPTVTDLVLVIHGIGQKLSERVESFHFTHSINTFRREVNVELGTESVKAHLRQDMGGVMILPVNWRLSLSFEEGGYRDETENPAQNQFTLKDITPETLPSVRNIVSDVMLDIPYYLSQEHNPKMLQACIREANRIYALWCANNPGFDEWGRVHLIAHSLGSVMAFDILSKQPTYHPPKISQRSTSDGSNPDAHFLFDTHSLFLCGSPAGFFLLLKKSALLPRRGRDKPGASENINIPSVTGEQGTYGCLSVSNIYNIVNPYDPVAYRLNAAVDATYSAALKPALVPSSQASWFKNPFRSSKPPLHATESSSVLHKPIAQRLPSNVELETHNFTREEIAEKRAYLLNDNGQIDFFLRYGGGPLEIQYLTMLGAHSSYWISKDFVRMIVVEVGRAEGREGTILPMRAMKTKTIH